MRAVVLGNKDLSVNCLEVLLNQGVKVAGIVLNPEDDGVEEGKWYRSLRKAAEEKSIPNICPQSVNSGEGLEFIRALSPDLLFSFSYAKIIKRAVLDQAKIASFNIHFGALPKYRGCLPLVNAMVNGESAVGVTLHHMDEGIDTGAIVAQRHVTIEETDTAFSLYFKCVAAGTSLFQENLSSILSGDIKAHPQNLEAGSYYRQEYPRDRWVDETLSLAELSRFIRALTFHPYPTARVMFDKEYDIRYQNDSFSIEGLGINDISLQDLHRLIGRKRGGRL